MKVVNAKRFRRKPVLAFVLRVLIESRFRKDFLVSLSCSSYVTVFIVVGIERSDCYSLLLV